MIFGIIMREHKRWKTRKKKENNKNVGCRWSFLFGSSRRIFVRIKYENRISLNFQVVNFSRNKFNFGWNWTEFPEIFFKSFKFNSIKEHSTEPFKQHSIIVKNSFPLIHKKEAVKKKLARKSPKWKTFLYI